MDEHDLADTPVSWDYSFICDDVQNVYIIISILLI